MTVAGPIFTVGHSTRTIEQFIALLRREGIRHLVDVRRFPVSRRYPHFDSAPLAASLLASGISYEHAPDLGGRRSALPESRNVGWRNASFRGYADYMATSAFQSALDRLVAVGKQMSTVVMCAEAVPWRCHRTLIADALHARGLTVRHILDAATKDHTLTSFAVIRSEAVEYPGVEGDDLFTSAGPS
jgi:uncharacterized protein (DUF488 family)